MAGLNALNSLQHAGVKAKVLQDLDNLRTIVHAVAKLEPDFDFGPIVNEW